MENVVLAIHLILAMLLIGIVLLQRSEGGGLGKISISPVTGETILEITDFCDENEEQEQKELWESQINQLRKETGSGG